MPTTRSISGSRARGLLVFAAVLGAEATAAAEPPEPPAPGSFREAYERAGRLYAAKDYGAAIPALHAAYGIQPVPQLLFNIAQAYRHLEQWSSSRVYFEMYRVLLRDPSPEKLEIVERALSEVRTREQEEKKPQIIEKTRTLVVQTERPVPRWLRPVGITSGVVGLGLLAAGGTFLGINGRCSSAAVPPATECDRVYSTGTLGTSLTAAGGVVLILGVVTLSLSLRKPAQPTLPRPDEELPTFQNMMHSGIRSAPVPPGMAPALIVPKVDPHGGPEPPPESWNTDGTPKLPEPPPYGWSQSGARTPT